jgi:hypothetical protein
MNEAAEVMVQQPVEQPLEGSRADYDAVIQRSFARTEARWRQERGPSAEGVPYGYLLATDHFLAEPNNPSQALEYLKGDAKDPLDLRFTLQTTLNYLELRNAEGKCNDDELKTLDNVKDLTGSDDPEKAITQIKSTIRSFLPQDDIKSFLPDITPPEGVRKDKLGIKEVTSLATLILREDEHKAHEDQSSVHMNCVDIIDRGTEDGVNVSKDPRVRRSALTTLMDKLQNEDDTLAFLESHDPFSQKILYHFADNPGLLVKMYLHDLDTGKPEIFKEGELIKKVAAVLGGHPEAEFLKRSAESVDYRMHGLLKRLVDPATDEYRVSVTEYMNSEKELHKGLEAIPDPPNDIPLPEQQEAPRKIEMKDDYVPKEFDLEKFAPGISDEITKLVQTHLDSNLGEYSHKQVETVLGLTRPELLKIQKREFVRPSKADGDDNHPVFTPVEAISAAAFKLLEGRQVHGKERKAVHALVEKILATSSQQSLSQVS